MKTPCEEVIKEIIPTVRALIAKDLCLKYGFTQIEAAKKLGITQAAISQYISSKRGGKKLKKLKSLSGVKSLIQEISKNIAEGKISKKELSSKICTICKAMRKEFIK